MYYTIEISKSAKKDLLTVPQYIAKKLLSWVLTIEEQGLREVMKIPGYHDEPLKGQREGQRSIRLSRSYRAIYAKRIINDRETIVILEVHKHDY